MSTSISYILRVIIIVLLLGCLAKMPYGYFQFVRLSTCIMFLVLAIQEYEKKKVLTMLLCFGFAIMLNPVLKIHFTRTVWNGIDVFIAVCLCIWTAIDLMNGKKARKKD